MLLTGIIFLFYDLSVFLFLFEEFSEQTICISVRHFLDLLNSQIHRCCIWSERQFALFIRKRATLSSKENICQKMCPTEAANVKIDFCSRNLRGTRIIITILCDKNKKCFRSVRILLQKKIHMEPLAVQFLPTASFY